MQQVETQALLFSAAWKLDGKGRVANGEEIVVCTVPGLSFLVGRSIRGGVLCAAVGQHPACKAWGSLCNVLLLLSFPGRGPSKEE